MEMAESNVTCECGYVGNVNDKYCAECGKNLNWKMNVMIL